jgi:hypothetical protein
MAKSRKRGPRPFDNGAREPFVKMSFDKLFFFSAGKNAFGELYRATSRGAETAENRRRVRDGVRHFTPSFNNLLLDKSFFMPLCPPSKIYWAPSASYSYFSPSRDEKKIWGQSRRLEGSKCNMTF